MKHRHYSHCVIGVAVAVALVVLLGVSGSTIAVAAITLLCPLMMFVMMRSMMGGQRAPEHEDPHPVNHSSR